MLPEPSEAQKVIYRQAFVRNCLLLLLRGYTRLTPNKLQGAEEPHITGEIVRSVRDALEADDAESWMKNFEILDDPPQNTPGVFGKYRPRIDIEFVHVRRGPRPRFHIEAKRLYRRESISEYFGDEGLGMFVAGTYAASEPSAGMLGYVQAGDTQVWLGQLANGFVSRAKRLQVCEAFRSAPDYQDISAVRISGHQRTSSALGRIDIYHLLLKFL